VFEPGFKSLQKNFDLCLDDFARKKDVIPAPMLEELLLCIRAPSKFPRKWLDWYYSLAVENLLKAAPNLKALELNGGYVFNPKEDTVEELKKEIGYLDAYLRAVAKAIQGRKVHLRTNVFNVAVVFGEEVGINRWGV
jgi:hypothetical protein